MRAEEAMLPQNATPVYHRVTSLWRKATEAWGFKKKNFFTTISWEKHFSSLHLEERCDKTLQDTKGTKETERNTLSLRIKSKQIMTVHILQRILSLQNQETGFTKRGDHLPGVHLHDSTKGKVSESGGKRGVVSHQGNLSSEVLLYVQYTQLSMHIKTLTYSPVNTLLISASQYLQSLHMINNLTWLKSFC